MQLIELDAGEQARVIEIASGHNMRARLERMRIREGTCLVMISNHMRRGPIVISVLGAQVAIGHGMASRIKVESLTP